MKATHAAFSGLRSGCDESRSGFDWSRSGVDGSGFRAGGWHFRLDAFHIPVDGSPSGFDGLRFGLPGPPTGSDGSHLLILTAALRVRRIALRVCLERAPSRGVGPVASYPARGGLGAAAYSAFRGNGDLGCEICRLTGAG